MFSTGGRGGSTVPNLLYVPCYRGNKECRVLMQKFGVVQAPRTSSNLLEPQQHRVSKVWRGLSQAFGVGRLYRTFSIYSVTGETRSAGLQGKQGVRGSSTSNLSEPTRTTTSQREQGVERFVTCVRGGSTVPNLLFLQHCRGNKVCRKTRAQCPRKAR